MKKLRNILALALISFALFSCDTDYFQDRMDDYTKVTKKDKKDNNTHRSTGGDSDSDDSDDKDS